MYEDYNYELYNTLTREVLPPTNEGELHVPVVLLVDLSGSMYGPSLDELNEGLIAFQDALNSDQLALGRAEICIITFESRVDVRVGFRPAIDFVPPRLSIRDLHALTSLNGAINKGLDEIEGRKRLYRSEGIHHYRPWLFLMTDGDATDTEIEESTRKRLRNAILEKKVTYLPMGIGENVNFKNLQSYYPKEMSKKVILKASADDFCSAFSWLSASVCAVAHSDPGSQETITLPPTPPAITVGI